MMFVEALDGPALVRCLASSRLVGAAELDVATTDFIGPVRAARERLVEECDRQGRQLGDEALLELGIRQHAGHHILGEPTVPGRQTSVDGEVLELLGEFGGALSHQLAPGVGSWESTNTAPTTGRASCSRTAGSSIPAML
ncbi:MAG: hypothetical protein M3O70_14475 [Actinomycetota bacterium]|nr:hypothetical protein [Actinomycetota bacterium]